MLALVHTGAVHGVEALLVRTEVHIASGLPAFTVVGLAHGAVREGRDRIQAALRSSGLSLPSRRVTVNLAPADVRKAGTGFDLPIAVGILAAAGDVAAEAVGGVAFVGELGLDGSLRAVSGVLPFALRCRDEGLLDLVVPEENAAEAAAVVGLRVVGARSLRAVVDHLTGTTPLGPVHRERSACGAPSVRRGPDLSDVRGQETAKRVLEIAAAGAHNLLFVGPPGAGKTMLARRMPGILPPLTLEESLEASTVHSVAGLLRGGSLLFDRPFRAPHHSVSYAGLAGGGTPVRPGEISLAHHGVLFLDELAEYRRDVLEVLRQPMEEGAIRLSRASGPVRFPARFLLVAAMNPCPCGHAGDGTDRCLCDDGRVARYRARVSGPLLDRIDLHLDMPAVRLSSTGTAAPDGESALAQERVVAARRRQQARYRDLPGVRANGHLTGADLRRLGEPGAHVAGLLQRAIDGLGLSARAYHRIVKVARTIADLDGAVAVGSTHVAEALQYRVLDRGWSSGR